MPGVRKRPSQTAMDRFGRRVKKRREERKWSKSELARRMGVEYHTIIRWENGLHWPTPLALRVLAEELGTTPEALTEPRKGDHSHDRDDCQVQE